MIIFSSDAFENMVPFLTKYPSFNAVRANAVYFKETSNNQEETIEIKKVVTLKILIYF